MTPLGCKLLTQLLKGTWAVLHIYSTATPTVTPQTYFSSLLRHEKYILHSYNTFKYDLQDLGRTGITHSLEIRKLRLREVVKNLPKVLQLKGRRIQVLQLLIQSSFLTGHSYIKKYSLITSTYLLYTYCGLGTVTARRYK